MTTKQTVQAVQPVQDRATGPTPIVPTAQYSVKMAQTIPNYGPAGVTLLRGDTVLLSGVVLNDILANMAPTIDSYSVV